jgi:hypothetical protein
MVLSKRGDHDAYNVLRNVSTVDSTTNLRGIILLLCRHINGVQWLKMGGSETSLNLGRQSGFNNKREKHFFLVLMIAHHN